MEIKFDSEFEADISVPDGVCNLVDLHSTTFEINVLNEKSNVILTVSGSGEFYCHGMF